jgi:hypothetical protein
MGGLPKGIVPRESHPFFITKTCQKTEKVKNIRFYESFLSFVLKLKKH